MFPRDMVMAGDLIFTAGAINYYWEDPTEGIGHVGIATNEKTVIHAANSTAGIVESPIHKFLTEENYRAIIRLIPKNYGVLTIQAPPHRDVEISNDFRWIILQSL